MPQQFPGPASAFETREAITKFLFLRDEPTDVDLCFVLGCPTVSNMDPAIDLYRRKMTGRILISGLGPAPNQVPECELFRSYALKNGVLDAAILMERRATNTLENFSFSKSVVEQAIGWENLRSVAIVSKPFHMRRALMTARKQWPPHLKFIMLPTNRPDDPPAETWWQTEHGRRYVLHEIKAIGQYALDGHIGDF